MPKKKHKKSVFIIFTTLLLSLFIIAPIDSDSPQGGDIVERGANYDIERLSNGFLRKTYYPDVVNIQNRSGDFIPFEEYLNISDYKGKIKFETQDGNICYLEINYEKVISLSKIKPEINITKNRGNYYFTTSALEDVKSMSYKMNCTGFKTSYVNEKFMMDNIQIDFKQARTLQNISTVYDEKTKILDFSIVDKKMGNLKMIDPLVDYNFSTQTNIWSQHSNDCEGDGTQPPTAGTTPLDWSNVCSTPGWEDDTANANLDASDDGWITEYTGTGEANVFMAWADIQETVSEITLLNWTFEGHQHSGSDALFMYLWNETSTDWVFCQNTTGQDTDEILNCEITNKVSDFANSSGYTHIAVQQNGVSALSIDFVKLEVTYDDTTPSITILSPVNNTNTTNTNLEINFSVTDESLDSCWWSNNSGVTNQSIACGTNITSKTWDEGSNIITIFANDSIHINETSLKFTLDTSAPNINIIIPSHLQEFSYNHSMPLNFTITDDSTEVNTCWYNLDFGTNITISNCLNTTFNVSEGSHTANLYANDSLGNEGIISNSFGVSLDAPSITLNNPLNGTYWNNITDFYFNFTATDSNGLDTCELWGNWTGTWHKNYTWINPTNSTMNWTQINLTETAFIWNVFCNDTTNAGMFSTKNISVVIDLTNPLVYNLNSVTTLGSQTFTFSFNATDDHLSTCFYSVYNSSGDIDMATSANTSVSCNSAGNSETVSDYGSYTLIVYSNDSAGNINSSSDSLTISPSPTTPPAGGGGESTVIVVGNLSWKMETPGEGKIYEFQMSAFDREDDLDFTNNGSEEIYLNLTCGGELCDYISFSQDNVVLPVGQGIKTRVGFKVLVPDNVSVGDYVNNIIAMDQYGGADIVTLRITLSGFSLSEILDKPFSLKTIGKIKIPYILLMLFVLIIVSVIVYYILFKKVSGGKAISFIFGFIGAMIILVVL